MALLLGYQEYKMKANPNAPRTLLPPVKREPYGSKIKAKREAEERELQALLEKLRTPEMLEKIREVLHD